MSARGRAPDQEAAHAAHPPGALELLRLGLRDRLAHERAGVEHDQARHPELLDDVAERVLDEVLARDVATVGACLRRTRRAQVRQRLLQARGVARGDRHGHAAARAAARDRPAQARPDPEHQRGLVGVPCMQS
ncbi:MAG: hypothetical protein U5K43_05915 [Halofilum sp. (in: g-proteobacteria)]|nr:hypothetical protein [Halofilum sp. (in: g-proteobacteria)]